MHAEPDRVARIVEAEADEIAFHYVDTTERIAPMLQAIRPDAVFGISQATFPGSAQRAALTASSVRWFQVGGVGYDHLGAWDRDKVVVTNCGGLLAPFLAETMTGAMLALNANFPAYWNQKKEMLWQPIAFRPLQGRTLLIVGAGAIGGRVGRNAKSLGMKVLSITRSASAADWADESFGANQLDEILPKADFISVHIRLSEETRHLFDRRRLALLKADAIFMNASRGAVVDEEALIDALRRRSIRAAYLDVFEKEPLDRDSPLWSLENVMITPHASDNVVDWQERFAARFNENLQRWNSGQPLLGLL